MTTVRRRLAVLFFALAVLIPLLHKSRSVSPGKQAAFLRYTAGTCLVKVAGAGHRDGVYRISDGADLSSVNKMTGVSPGYESVIREGVAGNLKNGDVVVYGGSGGNNSLVSVKNMTVAERVSLGIPLDPDAMSVGDWEALPGIGPTLAKAIVADRQKYGAFRDLNGVNRVPGVGQRTLNHLRVYFEKD